MGIVFKREIVWMGDTAYIPLPRDMWSVLGIVEARKKPEVSIMPDAGRHGEYIAIFNEQKQKEATTKKE